MLILAIIAAVMLVTGASTWLIATRFPALRMGPTIEPATIKTEVRRHPRLGAMAQSRLDPTSTTGLALTAAVALVVLGVVGAGVLLFMVRRNVGFARFDLSAARFGAHHATSISTSAMRTLAQLGGAVLLLPLTAIVAVVAGRRRPLAVVSFLVLVVVGQFAIANTIKAIVDRARPDIDQLTHFSGTSFPSGHAVAAAASFAAFALVLGRGRSARTKALLAGVAVALATGIACTRVFLGVHWLTDVLAGLVVGWAWFALCSIAFGGRLLSFGAPAVQAERAADAIDQRRPLDAAR